MTSPYSSYPQTPQSNPRSHTHSPHLLNLPYLQPQTNGSSSSLLEAVVGRPQPRTPPTAYASQLATQVMPVSVSRPPAPAYLHRQDPGSDAGVAAGHGSTEPSTSASSGSHGESDWDMVSKASGVNGDGQGEEAVKDLEQKVEKRRSQLPCLESQLAELEAQIKAAEERIARAQSVGSKGSVTQAQTAQR
ncbi:hypothetical protein C367_02083 [Cryptococcus neoformans Ze90-1]|nr:hypothetical protein C367_02083 [Cryptococcus neoformans var. grubii Ze90-1]